MTSFKEEIDKCTLCGHCNSADPITSVISKETASTRFKLFLAKKGENNTAFYLCTDTLPQERVCPSGVKIGKIFEEARAKNVKAGVTTKSNEEMVKNFRETGFPYANMNPEDFHDKKIW